MIARSLDTPQGRVTLRSDGRGRWRLLGPDGVLVAVITRSRHTYRTTYVYTRIGYDRTHTCWRSDKAQPRECWPTLDQVVQVEMANPR